MERNKIPELIKELNKLNIEAMFEGKSKGFGTGAHCYIPKEFKDREVIVLIKK